MSAAVRGEQAAVYETDNSKEALYARGTRRLNTLVQFFPTCSGNRLKQPNPLPSSGTPYLGKETAKRLGIFNQKENNTFVLCENVPLKQNAPNLL